jgi:hypothetical protein
MNRTSDAVGAHGNITHARMCELALSCLHWAASGTGLGLAGVTAYVALRSAIYTVVAQPAASLAGAIVAVTMFFVMAAVVAVVVILPIAFAVTYTYALGARAGFFDDHSRRQLFLAALIVGGIGTMVFVWATGMQRSDATAESVLTMLGLWLAIATGWAGPRLFVRPLRLGRFSRVDVSAK